MSGTSGIKFRFVNALPKVVSTPATRARSNSASVPQSRSLYTSNSTILPHTFFDTPPTPPNSSRPANVIPTKGRMLIEARGEVESGQAYTSNSNQPGTGSSGAPYSLALTSSYHKSQSISPALASSYPFLPAPLSSAPNDSTAATTSDSESGPANKKHGKQRYQLDVGAYGIPKNARSGLLPGRQPSQGQTQRRSLHTAYSYDDSHLAVGVGEDAYFIRDNAMGVADGVGGWSKSKHAGSSYSSRSSTSSTPSAVFAKHLMHYCSAEIESCSSSRSNPHSNSSSVSHTPRRSRSPFPEPTPIPLFTTSHDAHSHGHTPWWDWSSVRDSISNPNSRQDYAYSGCYDDYDQFELEEQLEDSLEELEDGIDVLMILERAYQKTLDAHVVLPPRGVAEESNSLPDPLSHTPLSCSAPSSITLPPSLSSTPISNPLVDKDKPVPLLAGSSTVLVAVLDHVPRRANGEADLPRPGGLKSTGTSPSPSRSSGTEYDAVIKVAHVGDCMGMLVRGEEVVWRSEEMWWSFNTPVQLGPSSPATPATLASSAHVFTLPVEADDILILASDGLSDNLWDEDILDEVVRFRRSYLANSSASTSSSVSVEGAAEPKSASERILWRRTLAGLLSEALCSRARRVSERRKNAVVKIEGENGVKVEVEDEVPFARRAKEVGKTFKGGKGDDISVIVAVISPAADLASMTGSEESS